MQYTYAYILLLRTLQSYGAAFNLVGSNLSFNWEKGKHLDSVPFKSKLSFLSLAVELI